MKKNILFLSFALVFAMSSSCKKVNEATEFDIDYSTFLTIPSTSITVTAPADFTTPEIPTNSSSRFASEKTTIELVSEVKLTKFNISNPTGNLDFLKSLTIFLKSSAGEVSVATKTNIPKGVSSVSADLSGINIKDHIFKDKIQFRVSVTITTGLTATQQLKMDETVHVVGKKIS